MTADFEERRLPVGIQSFKEIRKGGYLYVDKTDLIWKLANKGKTFNYFSRPRRFGKSVLVDTLEAYFEGKKELFEGLKIMDLEKNWTCRPVIRLDMSRAGSTAEKIENYLNKVFRKYERKYNVEVFPNDSLSNRLDAIIETPWLMEASRTIGHHRVPHPSCQSSWTTWRFASRTSTTASC